MGMVSGLIWTQADYSKRVIEINYSDPDFFWIFKIFHTSIDWTYHFRSTQRKYWPYEDYDCRASG